MKLIPPLLAMMTVALACFGFFAVADAAETIVVKALVIHGNKAIAAPTIAVESGQEAVIRSGEFELRLQPTLLKDGEVAIATTLLTGADTPKPVQVAQPSVTVVAGKTATIQVGEWKVSLTPDIAR